MQVPAIFTANFPEDMPSLGLTGETNMDDTNMDDMLAADADADADADGDGDGDGDGDDLIMPRKRYRGERIVWTPEEDEYLRAAVQKYGDKTEKWAKIAACVPGRTNKNCRKRWFHSLDPSLKKGTWTEEEDHLLRTGVQNFKGQWSKIAERIKGRTDDQCAKRWRESLDPHIDRADWTPEDDVVLLQKFEEYGSQWQKIALSFPGRPGLHCRNRWRKIQRSLNHMHRASKRRRNQLQKHGLTATLNAEGMIDEDSTGRQRQSSHDDDYTLLDDSGDSAHTDQDKDDGKLDSNPDEEKPYGCAVPSCTFESSSPSLLFYHFKASHHGNPIQKPFRCTMPACVDRKRYKNINGLQYHVTHAKNTPGHGGNPQHDGGQSSSSPAVPATSTHPTPASLAEQVQHSQLSPSTATLHTPTATSPAPPGTLSQQTSVSMDPVVAPTSFKEIFANLSEAGPNVALAPTPAEIQLQISQQRPSQPSVSHQAFNIPHTPEPMDGMSSPMSMDITIGHPQTTLLQCPELGCGQTFHTISGLNAHMANNHGHRSLTMKSGGSNNSNNSNNDGHNNSTNLNNRLAFGSGSISIPEHDYDDMDMDLAYLASESSSPMDMDGHILNLDDAQLQAQLESMANEHGAMSLDPNTAGNSQAMSILSMNELLFANHISNSLNSNRIHFGSHINVSADEPSSSTLPSTPVPSANVSPRMTSLNVSSPTTPVPGAPAPVSAPTTPTKAMVVKKFPCSAPNCLKSYANIGSLRTHMRNDHPDIYTKPFKLNHQPVVAAIASLAPVTTMSVNDTDGMTNSRNALTVDMTKNESSSALASLANMDISHNIGPTISTVPALIAMATTVSKVKGAKQTKKAVAAAVVDSSAAGVLEDGKPYKCLVPGCGKGYTNINGLKNHLLQAHGSTPRKS
ncbi:hypothetical protein BGZ83_005898 [Gryganskiella cystojenkinii]|nr:hypothetical protein BGZ83_005898 [Gryganskiella cystojenkinii]